MKKTLSFLLLLVFWPISLWLSWCGRISSEQATNNMQHQLLSISNLYTDSLYKTDQLVKKAEEMDFDEFDLYLTNLISERETLEQESIKLEQYSDLVIDTSLEEVSLFSKAYAYYDKQTITNIFDNAPAWKKIKTLAKELWVSAKKAFSILKMSQSQLEAEARNTAWDKFETLENSARAVKDVCKVWLYVWWAALAWPAVWVIWEATMIIGWEDLILEIWEDTANMYYWYNNKMTAAFSDIRTITKPTTAILWIMNISQISWDPEEILDTFVFFGDQILWTVNENEFIWVNIDKINWNIDINKVPQTEKDKYITEMEFDKEPNFDEIIQSITEQLPSQTEPKITKKEEVKIEQEEKVKVEVKEKKEEKKGTTIKSQNNKKSDIVWERERIWIKNWDKQNSNILDINIWKLNLVFQNDWIVLLKGSNTFNSDKDITEMTYVFDHKKWEVNINDMLYAKIWTEADTLYFSPVISYEWEAPIFIFSKID